MLEGSIYQQTLIPETQTLLLQSPQTENRFEVFLLLVAFQFVSFRSEPNPGISFGSFDVALRYSTRRFVHGFINVIGNQYFVMFCAKMKHSSIY